MHSCKCSADPPLCFAHDVLRAMAFACRVQYWFNSTTGESSWYRPASLASAPAQGLADDAQMLQAKRESERIHREQEAQRAAERQHEMQLEARAQQESERSHREAQAQQARREEVRACCPSFPQH